MWRVLKTSAMAAANPLLLIAALLASLLPAIVVSLPIGALLSQAMDYSFEVQRLARRLSVFELAELFALYRTNQGAVQAHVGIAWICLLLSAPALYALLSATQVGELGIRRRLLAAALDYPRWLFLQLFAFLIWAGFVVVLIALLMNLEDYRAHVLTLEAWQQLRAIALLVVFGAGLLTHFLHLCARAEYLSDPHLHLPPLAYLRAFRAGRLGSRMLSYLLLGLMALPMLLVLSGLRAIEIDQPNGLVVIALVQASLVAVVLGWLGFARILCLSHYSKLARRA